MGAEPPRPGPLVWVLAGEASGDVLGARLIAALRRHEPALRIRGVGGPRMAEQGLDSLLPIRELAVMGLVEVLPRVRRLARRLTELAADIRHTRPDVVVTIDSPGFSLRLLRRIAGAGIPRLHWVAPQVWAWKEHRVKEFPGTWERLLCLLPFEPDWFAARGIEARFTGHPVVQSGADRGDGAAFRVRHGIEPDAPVLVLMPGSRRNEVPRLMPVFRRTVALLRRRLPDLVPVLIASPLAAEAIARLSRSWPRPPIVVTGLDDKHDAFAAAAHRGCALTKSGTSTLELALAGVPMAVCYRVNPVTAAIARRLIRVPYVAMVNILAGRELVPELLQERCRPPVLAAAVERLVEDRDAGAAQREGLARIAATLHPDGEREPADAAAREVLALLSGAGIGLPAGGNPGALPLDPAKGSPLEPISRRNGVRGLGAGGVRGGRPQP